MSTFQYHIIQEEPKQLIFQKLYVIILIRDSPCAVDSPFCVAHVLSLFFLNRGDHLRRQ